MSRIAEEPEQTFQEGAPVVAAEGAPAPSILGGKFDRPLASQGFEGAPVQHEDMKTVTSDWQKEFGPTARHRSIGQICKGREDNEWCRLHMLKRAARMQVTSYYWWDGPGWFPHRQSYEHAQKAGEVAYDQAGEIVEEGQAGGAYGGGTYGRSGAQRHSSYQVLCFATMTATIAWGSHF